MWDHGDRITNDGHRLDPERGAAALCTQNRPDVQRNDLHGRAGPLDPEKHVRAGCGDDPVIHRDVTF